MDVKTLKNLLEKGEGHTLLIDVREPGEVSDEPYFDIPPDNYIALPLPVLSVLPKEELVEKIRERLRQLNWNVLDVRIVTLCRSGRRSEMACPYFTRLGFAVPVESLDGGHESWVREMS
ncbi:MAG: rhodanese-like domain-containing protein [Candidatus Moraniibacteriota bacterium]